jgi:hypothetical protein
MSFVVKFGRSEAAGGYAKRCNMIGGDLPLVFCDVPAAKRLLRDRTGKTGEPSLFLNLLFCVGLRDCTRADWRRPLRFAVS